MTTRLSNQIRGVLKTFGMLLGAIRGVPFDRRVETLLANRDEIAAIVDRCLRRGNTHVGQERPEVPTVDERARYRGGHCASLRQYS
jgi:hypothetical protein